jgi:CheY-like chemotaxis protein
LVRRLVDLHGGRVCAESEGVPGRGSQFTVTLPWQPPVSTTEPDPPAAQQAEAAPIDAAAPVAPALAEPGAGPAAAPAVVAPAAPPAVPPAKATLLLAEDNDLNRTAVGDYLANCGYAVLTAANGLEALDLATEHHPDLILMDVQMPVLDGLEAVRRLRVEPATRTTPVIMLTALAMVGDRERCLAVGADAYLAKPITLRALTEQIETLLAARTGVSALPL